MEDVLNLLYDYHVLESQLLSEVLLLPQILSLSYAPATRPVPRPQRGLAMLTFQGRFGSWT